MCKANSMKVKIVLPAFAKAIYVSFGKDENVFFNVVIDRIWNFHTAERRENYG